MNISAFFPAYNEEGNVDRVVGSALEVLPQYCKELEVIVVDDGSLDRTAEKVERLVQRDARVRLIRHGQNRGYGAALRTGFAAASHEWVFFSDADGQFDLRDIGRLLACVNAADMIIGYRLRRQDPLYRRVNAALWNLLIRIWFGIQVRDVDCVFKLIRRSLLENMSLESNGAFVSTELLCKASKRKARIVEVGVPHYPRTWETQTGARLDVIARAFLDLWRLRKALRQTS